MAKRIGRAPVEVKITAPSDSHVPIFDGQTRLWNTVSTSSLVSDTASFALSSSYGATSSYADNFTVAGTLTAQTIVVQVITSSTELITGSLTVSGSLEALGGITGSLLGTSSFSISSSRSITSITSSHAFSSDRARSAITSSGILGGEPTYVPFFNTHTTLRPSVIYQVSNSFTTTSIAINENNVNSDFPEALYVFQPIPTSVNTISANGNINSYLQSNIQNNNQGVSASSDIVATANNGNEISNYVNMGINSENYASNFVGGANDAYVYSLAQNLYIGNIAENGTYVGFFVGGSDVNTHNKLRLAPNNSHQMTGSLDVSGSLIIRGGITGSLFGTASWALNAVTSAFSSNALSASYAESASTSLQALSASFASRGFGDFEGYFVGSFTGSYTGSFSGSFLGDGSQLTGIPATSVVGLNLSAITSGSVTASVDPAYGFRVNSNAQISGSTRITGSLSVTGSVSISGSQGQVFSANVDNINFTGSFFQKGTLSIDGVVSVTGSVTASLFGTASWARNAVTASYVLNAVSASNALTASYVLNAVSASFAASSSYALTASFALNVPSSSNADSASQAVSASYAGSASFAVSSSYAISSSYSLFATSASYSENSDYAVTASHALTASSADDFTVRGTLTAQTIVAQVITSSTDFVTGSTRFGTELSNTHQFTGSVTITGSFAVFGGKLTGDLEGTASWANNAITASYSLFSNSSSYSISSSQALFAISASQSVSASRAVTSLSSSYALSASYAESSLSASYSVSSSNALTASYVLEAISSSFSQFSVSSSFASSAESSSYAVSASFSQTASYVFNAVSASFAVSSSQSITSSRAVSALSSSYALSSSLSQNALTASYVLNAVSASFASTGNGVFSGSFSGSFVGNVTGSLFGTSSWSQNAVSASQAQNSNTASFAFNAVSSSFSVSSSRAINADTASYVLNAVSASFASSGNGSFSGSFSGSLFGSITGSLFGTASNAVSASSAVTSLSSSYALSASYSVSSSYAVSSSQSISASYAISASFAIQAQTASSADSFNVRNSLTASGLRYPTTDGVFANQVIKTNAAGTLFIDDVNTIYENIRNAEATTLVKGTPVYASGSQGANVEVYRADASDPAKMPVTYIVSEDINPNQVGRGIILGLISGLDLTGYQAGQQVYVASGGGWTSIKPTGSAIIQPLGVISKPGNGGQGIVLNPGPASLPNIAPSNLWIGDSNSYPIAIATSSIQNVISSSHSSTSVTSSFSLLARTASLALSIPTNLNITASNLLVSNNLTVSGTASFAYIQSVTGSAVIIGQEYVILNTQTPTSRFAGFLIYDSGSVSTSSIVWDSERDHFVYSKSSGSTYAGGMFIAGPKNTGSLGSEATLTQFFVPVSQGDDHIQDSQIYSSGSVTVVTGSLRATLGFTGSLFGTASQAVSASLTVSASHSNTSNTSSYGFFAISSSFSSTSSLALRGIITASAVGSTLTFTKGDSSTFDITILTGTASTASYVSSSNVDGPLGKNSVLSASFALTASYVPGVIDNNQTSSLTVLSSSYAVSASFSVSSSQAISSSFSTNSVSASYLSGSTAIVDNFTSSYDIRVNGISIGIGISTGSNNIAIGSGSFVSSGSQNIAIGNYVLTGSGLGSNNIGIGHQALSSHTGIASTAVGAYSLANISTGRNTALGNAAGYNLKEGTSNTIIGDSSMFYTVKGDFNSTLGSNTLADLITGSQNLAIGTSALRRITRGDFNIAIGVGTQRDFLTGSANTVIGTGAVQSTFKSGSSNTIIGFATGNGFVTGSSNTIIGANVGGLSTELNNNIIFSDGDGNIRARYSSSLWTLSDSTVGNFTGSLQGTSSWANNAITASYVLNSVSASFSSTSSLSVRGIITASVAGSTITFTKGDNSTFNITIDTATADTASYILSSNVDGPLGKNSVVSSSYAISSSLAQSALTASFVLNAVSASYALSASLAQSALTASYVLNAVSASQAQNANTASYVLNAISASFATLAQNANTASYVLNAVSASFASQAGTANTASFVLNAVSASFATSASRAITSLSSSFASNSNTSSFALTASSADDFTVRGTLTAQTIVAQVITSSTDFVTGSTRFGTLLSNTHTFTGSVSITGSLTVVGAGITGSIFGTASWSNNAISASQSSTASYVLNAVSSSFAFTASSAVSSSFSSTSSLSLRGIITASAVGSTITFTKGDNSTFGITLTTSNADSASYVLSSNVDGPLGKNSVLSSSFAISSSRALTAVSASYVLNAVSASFASQAANATTASFALSSISSSLAQNAITASYVLNAVSASFAATTSNVLGGTTNYVPIWSGSTVLSSSVMFQSQSNIGIGTENPSYKLDVRGTGFFLGSVSIQASPPFATRTLVISPAIDGPTSGFHIFSSPNTGAGYSFRNSTSELLRINNSGNLLVGTSTDSGYRLDVSGSARITSNTLISGVLTVDQGITGSLFGTSSWANNATSASYVLNAVSASFTTSSSFATTSSFANNFNVANQLTIDGTLTDYATVLSSTIGSNNVFTQATSSFTSAFFKYTIATGSNSRAGEVVAVWNGSNVQFYDNSTVDIGNTQAVTSSVSIVGGDVQFNFQTNTSGWRIKSMATFI